MSEEDKALFATMVSIDASCRLLIRIQIDAMANDDKVLNSELTVQYAKMYQDLRRKAVDALATKYGINLS
ncbi:MAG: hypothetical protein LH606_13490 [Cytophagaceae bacterium]|nr:hypothetical protein [Cytophagaceae bacterium]